MRDRDHVDREVMSVLDGVRRHPLAPNYGRWDRPILTPRCSAVMAAVEEYGFEMCVGYKDDGGTLLPYPECTKHGPCSIKTICRAWRTP